MREIRDQRRRPQFDVQLHKKIRAIKIVSVAGEFELLFEDVQSGAKSDNTILIFLR